MISPTLTLNWIKSTLPVLWNIFMEFLIVCLCGLWCYAAIMKLRDQENFVIQLGKSPMLTHFANFISISIPLIELAVALLLFPLAPDKYRIIGLYASLFLMVMFSAYIIVLLHISYYTPCSCGGILSEMSWNTHIVFNLVWAAIAALQIIRITKPDKTIYVSRYIKA